MDSSLKRSLPNHSKSDGDIESKPKLAKIEVNESQNVSLPTLTCFVAERKGEREEMQDAHISIPDYMKTLCSKCNFEFMKGSREKSLTEDQANSDVSLYCASLYGVYDGHAGSRASKFCEENLPRILAERISESKISSLKELEKGLKRILLDTHKRLDVEFLRTASKEKPSWKDGTTANTILQLNRTLYISNIGDSKAILARKTTSSENTTSEDSKSNQSNMSLTYVKLSKDHSPMDYDERMRIQKNGGFVKDGRLMGIIEVSRSIGDGPYKKHGLICVPDIKKCTLKKEDKFIILACDGLWKRFTEEESIKFVENILLDSEQKIPSLNKRYELACSKLADEAVRRLSADNVTVLLIKINNHP